MIPGNFRLAGTDGAHGREWETKRRLASANSGSLLQRWRWNMSRRKWSILVASVIVVSVGTELLVRSWSSSSSCVQVVNEGDGPMDDLVVSCANTKVALGRLGVGQSAKAWFAAAGREALTLDFRQKDSALKGFQIQEFNPVENRRNGLKLVLVIKRDRIERFMEDDEATTSIENLLDKIREWLRP